MSDPGLSHRLRQRSRRAGLMIGLSMLLTIALCAVAFTMIYAALEEFTSDFISDPEETPTLVVQQIEDGPDDAQVAQNGEPANDDDAGAADPTQAPTEVPTDDPTPTPDTTDDNEGFAPDYQIDAGATVNLREGPSTATGILDGLPPSTPLEYLDEDAPTDNSADGDRWMRFATEDGLEGWVREIDVTEYQP